MIGETEAEGGKLCPLVESGEDEGKAELKEESAMLVAPLPHVTCLSYGSKTMRW